MAQMAVRTIRVIARALVIPIADDARGENQQDDERQRNPEECESSSKQSRGNSYTNLLCPLWERVAVNGQRLPPKSMGVCAGPVFGSTQHDLNQK